MSGDDNGRPQPVIYWRCEQCHLVATYSSADWVISKDSESGIDWSHPVELSCAICYAKTQLSQEQVLALDASATCPRCQAGVPCPAEASRVECTSCGLTFFGPAADTPARRQEVTIQEGLTNLALRETYLRIRGRRSEG